MAIRKQLLDQNDNVIIPITDTEAVMNPQNIGGTLENRLEVLEEQCDNIPAISTNIETDATSETKAAAPKAVKAYVDSKVSSAYKAAGSVANVASLPTLIASNIGKVCNMTSEFTTTSDFVEGSGKTYPAGTNVSVVEHTTGVYKYDVMAGFFDLSGKADKSEMSVTDGTGANADKTTIQLKNGTSATVLRQHQSLDGYVQRSGNYTENNFASFDSNGGIKDSGKKATDLAKAVSITYAALKALRDGGNLVPGTWYRITDYHTTVSPIFTNTRSADHQFDVIVRADDASHLNESGYAAHHEGDEYFAACKLEAWELQYRLDNEKWSRVAGTFIEDDSEGFHMRKLGTVEVDGETYILWDASEYTEDFEITRAVSEDEEVGTELKGYDPETGEILDEDLSLSIFSKFDVEGDGQGTILMLKDEYGNQCPYDFKSIQFKRWAVTDSQPGRDGLNGKYMGVLYNAPRNLSIEDETDFIWAYTFSSDATGSEDQVDFSLDGTHHVYGNVLEMAPIAMIATNNLNSVVFYGEYNYCNDLGFNCYNNSFGDNCYNNSFRNDCYNNSFGDNCSNNLFWIDCKANSFGSYCQAITVFYSVLRCSVTGGSQGAPVKNAQILSGTANLTIAFAANKDYTQVAAKTTDGTLKIFNPADLVP